jgi:hypothetical protein
MRIKDVTRQSLAEKYALIGGDTPFGLGKAGIGR